MCRCRDVTDHQSLACHANQITSHTHPSRIIADLPIQHPHPLRLINLPNILLAPSLSLSGRAGAGALRSLITLLITRLLLSIHVNNYLFGH